MRLQQQQRLFLILRLVACLGILNEDFLFLSRIGIGVPIAQTYTRLHLVHILTASTAGTEGVPREFGGIHIDLDGIVNQWCDKHGGERSHALALRIERRDTHQTVYAVLALQIAVGILTALNLHGNALDTGLIAFLQVRDGHLVTMSLRPSHVHTHEHRCPVLTLCTSGTRVDLQHTVHRVFLLTEHVLQFQVLNELQCPRIVGIHLLLGHHLVMVEVKRQLQFISRQFDAVISFDPLFNTLHLLHLLLRTLHILPEVGSLRTQLLLLKLHFFLVDVEIAIQGFGSIEYILQLVLRYHSCYSLYIASMTSL